MNRRRTARAALLGTFALAALVAGCGDDPSDGTAVGGSGSPDDVVVSVEVVGAFTTPEMAFQTLPSTVVYGDGTRITPGAQIEIYPGPALPALQRDQLSDDDVAAIVDAARDAGLDRDDLDYGQPPLADAGDTVVTVTIDGETYVHTATALGFAEGPGAQDPESLGLTDEQAANRAALAEFVDQVSTLTGSASPELIDADRYRLWVRPASEVDTGSEDDDTIGPRSAEWTVDAVTLEASGCLPVEGGAVAEVTALLAEADALTRFDDGSTMWAVVARPVLAHEPTCPDAE